MAQALYKAALDKKLSPIERFELRMLAKRTRVIARIVRDHELHAANSEETSTAMKRR
jgi:hypothetical protein